MHRFLRPLLSALMLLPALSLEAAETPIRVGALAFGTLNWELAAIDLEKSAEKQGIRLEVQTLAGPDAGKIGIQGGSLDIIVSDWIWVAQQRQQGHDLTFVPFSAIHGALIVPKDSTIRTLKDLKGKRLGVAGGGQDKNWLLLRAAGQKSEGLDLEQASTVTYGAPPLLGEALKQGQLDAVLTYWNQAVKLEAQGYRTILDGKSIQGLLGLEGNLPTLGYVFHEKWAADHRRELGGFLKAVGEARGAICHSDSLWAAIASATQEKNETLRNALRKGYCETPVPTVGPKELIALAEIFTRVAPEGSAAKGLPSGVFWTHPAAP